MIYFSIWSYVLILFTFIFFLNLFYTISESDMLSSIDGVRSRSTSDYDSARPVDIGLSFNFSYGREKKLWLSYYYYWFSLLILYYTGLIIGSSSRSLNFVFIFCLNNCFMLLMFFYGTFEASAVQTSNTMTDYKTRAHDFIFTLIYKAYYNKIKCFLI